MTEVWRDIKDIDGNYQVSNLGDIKSLNYKQIKGNEQIMKPIKIGRYLYINLAGKMHRINRLVGLTFLDNPDNLPYVHHVDNNPLNNKSTNLKWVTISQNVKIEYETGRRIGKTNMKGKFGKDNPQSIKIKRIHKDGFFDVIIGLSEAARLVNGSASHISKVCRGKLITHKGFKWEYIN